jgi:hypothetical protein
MCSTSMLSCAGIVEQYDSDALGDGYETGDQIADAELMAILTRILGCTGAPDKEWTARPIGLGAEVAPERWDASGIDDLLDGMSRMEFVLRFTLSHPALSSTIVGTSRLDHLRANLEIAAKGPLPAALYEEAKRRLPES